MRVIFLDFDGVLISHDYSEVVQSALRPDPACVAALNQLIEQTGAKIVVSSMWRMGMPIDELQEKLDDWGVVGEVIGKTPSHWNYPRGVEIGYWFREHELSGKETVESFVILDDCSDMCEFAPFLIQTNPEVGFTEQDVKKAITLLEFQERMMRKDIFNNA